MNALEDVSELQFVLLWNTFIGDYESCWRLRVLNHINEQI